MPPTADFGDVRIAAPQSYAVREASDVRTRTLPGEPGRPRDVTEDAIIASLVESGLEEIRRVDLSPRRDLDPAIVGERGLVSLDVEVDSDEDAVVLLESDGVYSWHLPEGAGRRTRALGAGPRTAHFEIDLQPDEAGPAPGGGGQPGEVRTRGVLGDLVRGAFQAIVFRFAAPAVVGTAIERMEAHITTGLVHLAGADIAQWQPIAGLGELHLPTDRPARVLLLIHGTFGSTVSGFGGLAIDPTSRAFLQEALHSYDAVIGYNHRTLSVDPRTNARDLMARLAAYVSDQRITLDIITHSRGGLTTRSLLEYELPTSDWNGSVDNVVFVAATHAGTRLADPQRWNDLVDLMTNLAAAGGAALALLPGAGAVGPVVAGVIKGIGAFVKYLVAYAGERGGVPGLAAMMPEGPFVTEINQAQPDQPAVGSTNWYVVSSNFHVQLLDGSNRPPEFPRKLAVRLAEGFVDRIFEGDNDLVVDTASMGAIGLSQGGGFVRDSLALGTNDLVYHIRYFTHPEVIAALRRWLGVEAYEAAMAEPELMEMAPSPPEPAEPVQAHFGAEMPATVVVDEPATVRVRLSRTEIQPTPGTANDASGPVAVDADRPVTVQVVGKSNAEVIGTDTDIFALPAGGGTSELTFTVRALAVGPVAVLAIVRQGRTPLTTLELGATAVSQAAALAVVQPPASASVHLAVNAPDFDLPCLDIIECQQPDGSVIYHYAVRLEKGGAAAAFQSAPIHDRARTMGGFIEQIQQVAGAHGSAAETTDRLQNLGTRLFDLLFPEQMQAHLWAHRDEIRDLIVYADEPYVPWEIVHLKPPTGPRQREPRFLAQGGLVRWRLGGLPPRQIRVRPGRARFLCPQYRDPMFALTDTALEAQYLTDHFGATEVTATPTGVIDLLRSGRFDLLHFSGHGVADAEDILAARILLQGRVQGRRVEPQYLSATDVSENAHWRREGEPGPFVVLNACQVGRSGVLLTTAGGFADAFLDAGAAAFVSCLWSVGDRPSRIFSETLYAELLTGTPMGQATARAREQARSEGDPTWLAFAVYARPDAVLVRS